ncbi:MAG: TerC/Alx family metal homeostasis membrane protein [Chitinophagaceae bacterium]
MTHEQITYLVFGIVLVVALVLDLGLLSKKNATMSIKKALVQTCFWVGLAFAFGGFVWYEEGKTVGLEYISAYLMEWSLSIDNIFVFILIFGYFNIKEKYYPRVLLIGILMAIVFRIIFITVGIELVTRFEWLLYIFGAFLVYTGIKMFGAHNEDEVDIESNKVYKFLKRILPLIPEDGDGKLSVIRDGKRFYTSMFVVIAMLATTDIIFALDSIPAVFAISSNPLVVYTSNIFAVLGLRSLFFLLRGAVDKFTYLQQGIAIVLVFIGIKMLVTFFHIHIHIAVSLSVIVVCIAGSIFLSMWKNKKEIPS